MKRDIGVHALLILLDGKVALQEKTLDAPSNPGMISMFGGGLEEREEILEVLRRELLEELELDIKSLNVSKLNTYINADDIEVHVYTVEGVNQSTLQLHEGKQIVIDTPENLLKNEKTTETTQLVLKDFLKKHRF